MALIKREQEGGKLGAMTGDGTNDALALAQAAGQVVPIRGDAPSRPAVSSDAVTVSGSGVDPDISPTYARLK